ncbi:DUF3558 family protein [Gordonia sp. (in: high G+C Gram-positive bacteria)]|uniref:DUF3558 family protein n=1 Tax=Gordonia sp. (in: high G+C Gram-positive bacteria) TaxID=84139 RepID=UPI003F9DC944
MKNGRRYVTLLCIVSAVAACTTKSDDSIATSSVTSGIRQVDDYGNHLPFDTRHDRRWSSGNDGTKYEPCTTLDDDGLAALNVEPLSAADAAGSNGQTLRGCKWRYTSTDTGDRWNLSQFVGNSPGLDFAKTRRSGGINEWLPDETIAGRQVGVHIYTTGDQCDTYVQSGGASVITMVTHYGQNQPPISEVCDRALGFTRATIGKMPV